MGATHMLSAIFERFITMKKLLIPLISFTFICTVKATNIDDVIIKGLPVRCFPPVKATKYSNSIRGKVILLTMSERESFKFQLWRRSG